MQFGGLRVLGDMFFPHFSAKTLKDSCLSSNDHMPQAVTGQQGGSVMVHKEQTIRQRKMRNQEK